MLGATTLLVLIFSSAYMMGRQSAMMEKNSSSDIIISMKPHIGRQQRNHEELRHNDHLPDEPATFRDQSELSDQEQEVRWRNPESLEPVNIPVVMRLNELTLRNSLPLEPQSYPEYVTKKIWPQRTSPEMSYCDLEKHRRSAKLFTTMTPVEEFHSGLEHYLTELGWKRTKPSRSARLWDGVVTKCDNITQEHQPLVCAPRETKILLPASPRTWMAETGFKFGENIGCSKQILRYIPKAAYYIGNTQTLFRTMSRAYQNLHKAGDQDCFEEYSAFPQTFNLQYASDCQNFFENYYEEATSTDKFDYVVKLKNGKKGNRMFSLSEGIKLREFLKYEEGRACKFVKERNLAAIEIQPNITSLMIGKRAVTMRAYAIIPSMKPWLGYASPEFYLKRDDKDTPNDEAESKGTYLGHFAFSEFIDHAYAHMNGEVVVAGITKQMTNILRKTLALIIPFLENVTPSDAFNLLNFDFMVDKSFKLWLLEAGTSPNTSKNFPRTAGRQTKYLARILDELFDGVRRSKLNVKTDNDQTLIPLFDYKKSGVDAFLGAVSEKCANILLEKSKNRKRPSEENNFIAE